MDVSNKISIINSLMHEDRSEIRMNKSILLNTTYIVVSGMIAIAAFAITPQAEEHLVVCYLGIWLFFALYIATFISFKMHISLLRVCLDVREAYYKDLNTLSEDEIFNPLKEPDKATRPSYMQNYLFILPIMVFIVALTNTVLLICVI